MHRKMGAIVEPRAAGRSRSNLQLTAAAALDLGSSRDFLGPVQV
jgi:hypothetical protein